MEELVLLTMQISRYNLTMEEAEEPKSGGLRYLARDPNAYPAPKGSQIFWAIVEHEHIISLFITQEKVKNDFNGLGMKSPTKTDTSIDWYLELPT